MISMTGFGSASGAAHGAVITCEVRSVNHRFLTVRCGVPEGCAGLEPLIDRAVRGKIQRGSVNVLIGVESEAGAAKALFDADRIRQLRDELAQLKKDLGFAEPLKFEAILALPILWQGNNAHGPKIRPTWDDVRPVVERALGQLVQMRRQEGAAAQEELRMRIGLVKGLSERIAEKTPMVREHYRERLVSRLQQVVPGAERTPASDALFKEIASMVDRSDISEEVQRLGHHIRQFEKALRSKEKVGRRLDFLNQEMLRETNTIASKAGETRVIDDTIAIKAELERIKEQVENVE